MQHTCLTLLKEMLMTLDLAHQHGSPGDRKAADRLQRRCLPADFHASDLMCLRPAIFGRPTASSSAGPVQGALFLCRLLHDDQKESGLLPVLARLIKQFDRKYQSREHANDLVQCLHVVLRMLTRLGREGECVLLVSCL